MITEGNRLDVNALFELFEQSDKMRETVLYNAGILKRVRGGLRMAEKHRVEFDPRDDYWRRPERRLAIAYLAEKWTGRFAPATALRSVAIQLLTWFDQARPNVISYVGTEYEQAGGLAKICTELADHARKMAATEAWDQLRSVWAEHQKLDATLGADVATFLDRAVKEEKWESGFKRRTPWLGYLGASTLEELVERQAFFYGYLNLWTTTNAYLAGGAQTFAPVIQNTATGVLLDAALTWAASEAVTQPTLLALGRNDYETQDRSQLGPVREVYGFLTLQNAPRSSTSLQTYRDWFGISEDASNPYEQSARVGEITRQYLSQHSEMLERFRNLFEELLRQPLETSVEFEAVESPKVRKSAVVETAFDDRLRTELDTTALAELKRLAPLDAAAIALHICIGAKAYHTEHLETPATPPKVPHDIAAVGGDNALRDRSTVATVNSDKTLPERLRPYGERALAYLKAGFHVLFAGAPGTGKTTLAQFVGYAWNHNLDSLPIQFSTEHAPLTTVGNSAWSPFHTIGGLMPRADGTYGLHPGIFIDPESVGDDIWRLLNCALVLDEMNRADLDRCIGELYPLLSGSVYRVSPAGLPGVKCIENSQRFRVIATVNDANLDDIVFPISEGLARRFQRIDLPGASRDDVSAYLDLLGIAEEKNGRRLAAEDAVETFFEVARESNLLAKGEDDERLPFGVAYFSLVKEWLGDRLVIPDSTPLDEARELVAASLRTLGRTQRWQEALRTFLSKG